MKINNILKTYKSTIGCIVITAGIVATLTAGICTEQVKKAEQDAYLKAKAEYEAGVERVSILSYNEGWDECESTLNLKHEKKVEKLKAKLKAERNKPAKVVTKTEYKTVAAQADHSHCIPESDIVTMDKDKYDYYRVSIGDVNYDKYTKMKNRVNYTYADQERDIVKNHKNAIE